MAIGTGRLEIEGVDELHSADIATIPDRIEAGTFLIAGAIAGKQRQCCADREMQPSSCRCSNH